MNSTAPVLWVVNHLQFIGWPAILYTLYRILLFCFGAARTLTIVEQRVLKGEETIFLMANNHLPHIQVASEETNRSIISMHETLKLMREDIKDLRRD
jgi:hypothetical protein